MCKAGAESRRILLRLHGLEATFGVLADELAHIAHRLSKVTKKLRNVRVGVQQCGWFDSSTAEVALSECGSSEQPTIP